MNGTTGETRCFRRVFAGRDSLPIDLKKTESRSIIQIGDIDYELNERIATITLNRPDKFSAITESMPGGILQLVRCQMSKNEIHRSQHGCRRIQIGLLTDC